MNINIEKIKKDIIENINNIRQTKILNNNDIDVEFQDKPHFAPKVLPVGKMAVYCFIYNNQFLKIGKVNKYSKARYCSQHYNSNSSKSNLAKSLLNDSELNNMFNKDNIGDWIKQNTSRINFLIREDLGIFILNFIESYLHLKFTPKYEGYKKQRK